MADNSKTKKAAASEAPDADAMIEKKAASEKKAAEKKAEKKPASEKKATAEKKAEKKPASEKKAAEKKAEKKPASEKKATEKKAEKKPASGKKPATKKKAAADKTDALDAALEAAAAVSEASLKETAEQPVASKKKAAKNAEVKPSEAEMSTPNAEEVDGQTAAGKQDFSKIFNGKTIAIAAGIALVIFAATRMPKAQQTVQEAAQELIITAEAIGENASDILACEVSAETLSQTRTHMLATAMLYAEESAAAEEAAEAEAAAAAAAAALAAQPAAAPAAPSVYGGSSAAPNGNFQSAPYDNFKSRISNIHNSQSINSDVQGWIYVPGTNIDYPILQDPNSDLSYYLHRNIYKNQDMNGVIWTGPSTRFASSASGLSRFTTIYGHNWNNCYAPLRVRGGNDTMFEQLAGYHYLSTAQSYPYFYFSTEGNDYTVAIFACFYCRPSAFKYWSSSGGQEVINEARSRSLHDFDVSVDTSDKIITLSTCTRMYGYGADQKFVVMGRLLRDGETVENVSVSSNNGHWNP